MAARAESAFWRGLMAVVALALAIRLLVYVLLGRDVTSPGDFAFYHLQANLIADGRGWLEPFDHLTGVDHASAVHPPLWTLALALPSVLGLDSVDAHRIFGVLVGCVVVVLVALVARRLAGPLAGLVAALVAAIDPVLVGADGSLLSETLYGAFVLLAVLAAIALRERPRVRAAVLLGVLGGLAALTRGEGALLTAFIAVGALWGAPGARRDRLGLLVVTGAACLLTIAPWTLRTHARLGAWIPISTNEAAVVAGANCEPAYHGANMGGWDLSCVHSPPRPYHDEVAIARDWRADGTSYARDHLGRLLVVAPVRALRTFDLWQPRRQTLFAEGQNRHVAEAGVVAWFLLVPFALWGLVAMRRRGGPWLLLAAVPLALLVTSVVGYGAPRFRHPVDLVAIVAAATLAAPRRALRTAASPVG